MRSITAAHSSAHEPNRPTSVAAVFAPMPGTPGSPSDGSPRSIAISAYASPARSAGTPYFAATSGGPRISALASPRPTYSSRTGIGSSRTTCMRSRSPLTTVDRVGRSAAAQGADDVVGLVALGAAVASPAAASTSRIIGTWGLSPSGTTSGTPTGAVSGSPGTRCAL